MKAGKLLLSTLLQARQYPTTSTWMVVMFLMRLRQACKSVQQNRRPENLGFLRPSICFPKVCSSQLLVIFSVIHLHLVARTGALPAAPVQAQAGPSRTSPSRPKPTGRLVRLQTPPPPVVDEPPRILSSPELPGHLSKPFGAHLVPLISHSFKATIAVRVPQLQLQVDTQFTYNNTSQ